jgi:hypothetical protein
MANKFKEKQILAEILSDLYEEVEQKEKSVRTNYTAIGEVQDKDWRSGELLWEDEEKTIPKMTKEWGYVDKDEEDLTEDDRIKLKVCQHIKSQLEKMI